MFRRRRCLPYVVCLCFACGDDGGGSEAGDTGSTGGPSTSSPSTSSPSTSSPSTSSSGTSSSSTGSTASESESEGSTTTGEATDTTDTDGTGSTGPADGCALVFTEILHDPAGEGDSWEWIEILNTGDEGCDLGGWVLDDGNDTLHTAANIASGTVGPGELAVLFHGAGTSGFEITEENFREAWGDDGSINLIAVADWPNGSLGGDGDEFALWPSFDAYDGDVGAWANVHVMFTYDVADGFPAVAEGASAHLTDVTADFSDNANWVASLVGDAEVVESVAIMATDYPGGELGSPGAAPGL